MSRIAFFSIPAYGHTNPTVEVVRELTSRGHAVRYYSFAPFRERLEEAGAQVILCDGFLPPVSPRELERKVGRDFAALVEMVADTTLRMDEQVCRELREWEPACIVSDSMCFWGKLFARKLGIPYVCSTTTFAFNQYTAKLIRRGPGELWSTLLGMPRVNRKMALLRQNGYPVEGLLSLMQNDNDTDTVVYTSRAFQPMAETFSNRYAFVGPSVRKLPDSERPERRRPLVYVSLGTVMSRPMDFYRDCIAALAAIPADAVLSVGEKLDPAELEPLPGGVEAHQRVDQLEVLSRADVFLTHCGMNSANEAIYAGVPTVLFPQQSEEGAVAARMEELGLGIRLRRSDPVSIQKAVEQVLGDASCRQRTAVMAETFRQAGGAPAAADKILQAAEAGKRN